MILEENVDIRQKLKQFNLINNNVSILDYELWQMYPTNVIF